MDTRYRSRSLKMPIQQLIAIRQNLIYQIVRSFKPRLMLVDRSPLGVNGELAKALNWVWEEYSICSLAVGLRDILDEPATGLDPEAEKVAQEALATL